ncbi:hypothetical protein Tco_0896726 [Tanacetum coccineum]
MFADLLRLSRRVNLELRMNEEEGEEDPDIEEEISEDLAVAPPLTPDDHEQEAEADTVGTITRVPYSVRPFSGTFYVGTRPSRQVFAPGHTGRDVNTLHR